MAIRTVRTAGFKPGQDAVVLGGGPIGLLVLSVLRSVGAREVRVVEPAPARRDVALSLGADEAIDPGELDPQRLGSPHAVFVCGGVPSLVGQALRMVRPGGVVVMTGFSPQPPTFDCADLLHKEVTLRGCFIYVDEIEEAIAMLASGTVDLKPLITGIVPSEKATDAFTAMRTSPDTIKLMITTHPENLG